MYRKGKREDLAEKELKTQQMIDAMLPKVRKEPRRARAVPI